MNYELRISTYRGHDPWATHWYAKIYWSHKGKRYGQILGRFARKEQCIAEARRWLRKRNVPVKRLTVVYA